MNYTKITTKEKKWQHIITDELNTDGKSLICTLAYRFNVFPLKVISQNHTSDRLQAYIIKGNKNEGHVLLFITVDLSCDMVVDYSVKRQIMFDRQLSHFLTLAFIQYLGNKGKFNLSKDLFSKLS